MPLEEDQLGEVKARVYHMLKYTIESIEIIERNAEELFGENSIQLKEAIKEYLDDFYRNTGNSGEVHPEAKIYETSREKFQSAGLYGAQLNLKERQVIDANDGVRESLAQPIRGFFRRPFKKWVDIINNFLGSLIAAAGIGEGLKEIKDCMRDELPDED